LTISASGNGGIPVINGSVLLAGISGFLFQGFQVNGNITVQDSSNVSIIGTEADDTLQVILAGVNSNIGINGAGGNDTILISGGPGGSAGPNTGPPDDTGAQQPGIQVIGGKGDDHLTVDFGWGNPLPSGGLSFDGGDDYDVLSLLGGSFRQADFRAINSNSGTISLDGIPVTYMNIEPIYYDGNNTLTIDSAPGDVNETITVEYVGTAGSLSNAIKIAGIITGTEESSFETIYFTNVKNVIFNALGGDDIINVGISQRTAGLESLTIQGGTGRDTIRNNGLDILLADSADLQGGADLRLAAKAGRIRSTSAAVPQPARLS